MNQSISALFNNGDVTMDEYL